MITKKSKAFSQIDSKIYFRSLTPTETLARLTTFPPSSPQRRTMLPSRLPGNLPWNYMCFWENTKKVTVLVFVGLIVLTNTLVLVFEVWDLSWTWPLRIATETCNFFDQNILIMFDNVINWSIIDNNNIDSISKLSGKLETIIKVIPSLAIDCP